MTRRRKSQSLSFRRTKRRDDHVIDKFVQGRVGHAQQLAQAGTNRKGKSDASAIHEAPDLPGGIDLGDTTYRNLPVALLSLIFHLILLIIFALVTWTQKPMPTLVLEIDQSIPVSEPTLQTIEVEPIVEPALSAPPTELANVDIPMEFAAGDLDAPLSDQFVSVGVPKDGEGTIGQLDGYDSGLAARLLDAQVNGIDIVVVFDSTGSMKSEIDSVKRRIEEIGTAVLSKIPKARFSLVTYRDYGEQYVARGVDLSDSMSRIRRFAGGVYAVGGGDEPEAVEAGMRFAIRGNKFREEALKVMLIFGDAPPHEFKQAECLELARYFRDLGKAQVSTITCKRNVPINEFYEIARTGGGDAYVLSRIHNLMEDILVIAFGVEHREQILDFFELRERPAAKAPAAKAPGGRRAPKRVSPMSLRLNDPLKVQSESREGAVAGDLPRDA